jgi:hypothetical protein
VVAAVDRVGAVQPGRPEEAGVPSLSSALATLAAIVRRVAVGKAIDSTAPAAALLIATTGAKAGTLELADLAGALAVTGCADAALPDDAAVAELPGAEVAAAELDEVELVAGAAVEEVGAVVVDAVGAGAGAGAGFGPLPPTETPPIEMPIYLPLKMSAADRSII